MTREGQRVVRPWRRQFRWPLIFLLLAAVLTWLLGLLNFVNALARQAPDSVSRADGVVVLTGGTNRLQAGFALLAAGKARQLLISGVNADVTHEQLRRFLQRDGQDIPSQLFRCCVELGFTARDTRGNARETAAWSIRRNIQSLLLVTSNYHMARSMIEFRHTMPSTRIEAFPVVADKVVLDSWWRSPGSVQLFAFEYTKFLVARLRIATLDGMP